jgi:hypothetical protein
MREPLANLTEPSELPGAERDIRDASIKRLG